MQFVGGGIVGVDRLGGDGYMQRRSVVSFGLLHLHPILIRDDSSPVCNQGLSSKFYYDKH